MERPVKKASKWVPKMVRTFAIYLILTLSVFFGYIEIAGKINRDMSSGSNSGSGDFTPPATIMDEITTTFQNFSDINVQGFNFSVANESMNFKISLEGDVQFDREDKKAFVDLKLGYNPNYKKDNQVSAAAVDESEIFKICVNYEHPYVYIKLADKLFKFDVNAGLDMQSLIEFIKQNVKFDVENINLDELMTKIGLGNFDIMEMVSQVTGALNVKVKDAITDEQGNYTIYIGLGLPKGTELKPGEKAPISIRLICDKDFCISSVVLKNQTTLRNGNQVVLRAENIKMNKGLDIADVNEEENMVDMSGLSKYLCYGQNLYKNDFVKANAKIKYKNQNVDAVLTVDSSNKVKAKLDAIYEGAKIEVIYADEDVYLDVEGLKFKFKAADFKTWRDKIEQIVKNQTNQSVADFVKDLANKKFDLASKNVNIVDTILDILAGGEKSQEKLVKYMPDNTTLTENQFAMTWESCANITLSHENEMLKTIKVLYDDVDIDVNFEIVENGFDVVGEYFDLTNILPISEIVDRILTDKGLEASASINVKGQTIKANLILNFENDIKASISTKLFGENINVFVDQNKVYLQIGEIVVSGEFAQIDSYIQKIDQMFGTNVSGQLSGDKDVASILAKVVEILNNIKIEKEDSAMAVVKYLNTLAKISIDENKNLKVVVNDEKFDITATIFESTKQVLMPTAAENIDDLFAKIENIKTLIDGKKFGVTFDLSAYNIALSGTADVDLENKAAVVTIKNTDNTLNPKLIYKNETLYVECSSVKVKVKVESVKDLIDFILPIINKDGSKTNTQNSNILTDIFGEDIASLSVTDLLEKIDAKLCGSTSNLAAICVFGSAKTKRAEANITFVENNLDKVEVKIDDIFADAEELDENAQNIVLTARFKDFEEILVDENQYFDILSAISGTANIAYTNGDISINVTADIKLKLGSDLQIELTTRLFDEDFAVIVLGKDIYVKAGSVKLHTSLDNLDELTKFVSGLAGTKSSEKTLDIEKIVKELTLTNIVDISTYVSTNQNVLTANYSSNGLTVGATLTANQTFDAPQALADCEELSNVLKKVEVIKKLADRKLFETTFSASYNGFAFDGTIKYQQTADGKVVFEIFVDNVCGENVVLRLQDNMIYISYGNVKIKRAIESGNSENKTTFAQIQDALAQITSSNFAVEINFGVFGEIVELLRDLQINDYFDRLAIGIDGTTNNLNISLSNKKEFSKSQILNLNVSFDENNLPKVGVDIYGILLANIEFVDAENSTIKPYDESDYADFKEDFIQGLFDSLAIEENANGEDYVYAFESDIAIRYSKNTFRGELVAMLVRDENNDTILGNYKPAISLHTTSLGLNSYVYYIDDTAYIDINGLQIKAQVNEETINEITAFVKENFTSGTTEQEAEEVAEVFRVILPAIDKIYGSWVEGGVQFNINDKLWYAKNANFGDIVAKVLVETNGSTIVPTEIVLGANIDDPNTTTYDGGYADAWLEEEQDITKALNFAVYFENVKVGTSVKDLDSIFVVEQNENAKNYNNILSVKSNYETSLLENFNDYKTVFDAVKTTYDYLKEMKYQFNVKATIAGETSMTIGGDIIAELSDDDAENPKAQYRLNDKLVSVQGDLDITTSKAGSSVRHLVSLLYSNYQEGLYVTYSHGNLIGNKSFKAKIANSHMSEIVAMVARFAGIGLNETAKESLNLVENTTDFRYLRELLGMANSTEDYETSKVDEILSSVTSMTKMLKNIKLEKKQISGSELFETKLSVVLDWENTDATVTIVLREETLADGSVKLMLREISISNFVFANKTLNVTLLVQDFNVANFDYNTSDAHIDLSDISSFLDVAVSTLNTKGFNFKGNTVVNIPVVGTVEVGFDILAKLNDQNKLELYMELNVGEKREVTWSAVKGKDTYTTYNVVASKKAWDKRITKITYANGTLNIENKTYNCRSTDFSTPKDIVKTYSYSKDQIGDNIMLIVTQSLGLTDTVHDIIKYAISKIDPHPTIEEAVLGFEKKGDGYVLKINAENLTGMSGVKDMELTIGVSQPYKTSVYVEKKVFNKETKEYETKSGYVDRYYRFIDSITTEMNISDIIIIPVTLNSASGTSYVTGGGATINTNDYYRKMYIDRAKYREIKFIPFCDNCLFNSALLASGEKVVFPELSTKQVTENNITSYYEFDGWYYDNVFKKPVEGDVYVQDDDIVFFAKWKFIKAEKTNTINIYHNRELIETLHIKIGDEIDMSVYDFVNENSGFYIDEAWTTELDSFVVGDSDLNIYVVQKYLVNVYHNNVLTEVLKFREDELVDLTTLEFVDLDHTHFYSSSDYQNEVDPKFTMGGADYSIYLTEKYTVTMQSEYGVKSATFYGFVGDLVALPEQTSFEELTDTTKTTYTFLGYSEEIYSIPDHDVLVVANWNVETVESYKVNVYNYKTLVDTTSVVAGEKIDLSKYEFVKDDSQICEDENFENVVTDLTVTDFARNIYVRNKFTVNVVSEYGENATYTDWQGTKINLPAQHKDTFDDNTTKRIVYTFNGYTFSDGATELTEIGDHDVTVTANWSVDSKNYYKVSFDTTFVKPSPWIDADSNFRGKVECLRSVSAVGNIVCLEGTTLDLTNIKSTTKYKYTCMGIGATYEFVTVTWNLSGCKSITDGVTNSKYDELDSITVNSNVRLYAVWGKA